LVATFIDRAVASRFIPWFCTVFVFILPISVVVWGLPSAGTFFANKIPVSWEQGIGRYTLRSLEMLTAPTKLTPTIQAEYSYRVKKLAELASVGPVEVHFRDAEPNAYAMPGNIILITDGLVRIMGDATLVDSIIAHELGHLHNRHGIKSIVSVQLFTKLVLRMNGQEDTAAKTSSLLASLTLFPFFSRAHETEADEYAFFLLKKNEQSPLLFVQAMNKLSEYKKVNKLDKAGYADSHPSTQQRILAAEISTTKN
jgi:Zn-dependent protease with chaperone function